MGAIASLSDGVLAVEPGGETACEVKVRNTGSVVDQFTIDVLGEAGTWTLVEPPVLSLFPGAEATARVAFKPPRGAKIKAGPVPFGVRVWSREDPDGSIVEEGELDVAPFTDVGAELLPRTSRGRRRARHELAIDNRGNAPTTVDITAVDPDEVLLFQTVPPVVTVPPGSAVFTRVQVRPKKRFLTGPNKTIPFQVVVTSDSGKPVVADGAMLQEPLAPKWLIPAVLALVALALILAVLWMTVLKPSVESAAKEAVNDELAAQQEQLEALEEQAAAAQEAADTAAQDATETAGDAAIAADAAQTAEEAATTAEQARRTGDPLDFRITASVPVGSAATAQPFPVPDGQILSVTDIQFQNPRGDSGTIEIRRNGNTILEFGLGNFRDYDYHVVTPLRFEPGEQVELFVNCEASETEACSPSAFFSAVLTAVQS